MQIMIVNYSRFRTASVQALREVSIILYVMRPGQQPMQYCSSFEGVSVFDQAVLLLPCWTNTHCPRPGLNVVIIGPPSHRLYREGISCHHYEIFNRQNDKKKT